MGTACVCGKKEDSSSKKASVRDEDRAKMRSITTKPNHSVETSAKCDDVTMAAASSTSIQPNFHKKAAVPQVESLQRGQSNQVNSIRRLANQKKELIENPTAEYRLDEDSSTDYQWTVIMNMSSLCAYKGKEFEVIVKIPTEYPNKRPQLRVASPQIFYHPNIRNDGYICEAIVTKDEVKMQIRQRLDAFVQLLKVPNPDSAWNSEAARQYQKDQQEYFRKALYQFNGIQPQRREL